MEGRGKVADVREDRSVEGLRAGFIQFTQTVFADEPLYRHLSLEIAEDEALLGLAAGAKAGQYPPYVFFAAVHYLLLADESEPLAGYYPSLRTETLPPEDAFPSFRDFCNRHEDEIQRLVSSRLVQANEVGRSACLAPAFAEVGHLAEDAPLHLIDIGAAAGLNLYFDRYFFDYGAFEWGNPDSRVRIGCELSEGKQLPLPGWQPNLCHRVGVDLNPIDVTATDEARWLRALIRPDRRGLDAQLAEAMAAAAQDPPRLLSGDAVVLLPDLLAEVAEDETPCVYHSYALEYFPEESRKEFGRLLDDFGSKRELYFVEMFGPGERGRLQLTSWRMGEREVLQLAECSSHGAWLRWLA
jgi:hypothetical protein